jgi:ribosomal protein L11 methyltransferase
MALWSEARAIATDIDPISIDVTRDNAAANGVKLGEGAGELALAIADGMAHPALAERAPFDLLIANILAGPLIELAEDFVTAIAPGGTILLAGLLDTQAQAVTAAYVERGCRLVEPGEGEWRVLVLERR